MKVRVPAAALLLGSVIFLGVTACGKGEDVPDEPTLVTDRDSLGFGQEFGSGVYVGASKTDSLLIQNKGRQDLVISGVDFVGPNEFGMSLPEKLTVKSGDHTFLQFTFTPTEVTSYTATATIHSNAANSPDKLIQLSGRGVDPSTDGGM